MQQQGNPNRLRARSCSSDAERMKRHDSWNYSRRMSAETDERIPLFRSSDIDVDVELCMCFANLRSLIGFGSWCAYA